MAGSLIVGDFPADQRVIAAGCAFLATAQGVVVATHQAAGAEERQIFAVKETKVLIVADQGTTMP